MEEKLKYTKMLINCILTASENALSLGQLEAEYKIMESEFIPYKELGFKSLLEFLQKCSDCVRIIHVGGTAQLLPVVGEESKHIRALVENQKKDPSKKVAYKITQQVEENILRILARAPEHKLPLGRLSSLYLRSYNQPLPAPRGKLVAWLGTSNMFAVLSWDKNVKIIEPLSHVDLNRYRTSKPLPESTMMALRNSVQNALSRPTPSNRLAASTSSYNRPAPVPNGSDVRSRLGPIVSQSATNHVSAPLSRYVGASFATQSTGFSATPAFGQTQFTAGVAPTGPSAQPQQTQSTFTQAQPTVPDQSARGLTPEVRQMLINFMMKNPESTSVAALHRAYEYHRGRIDMKTFLSWLISMEECLVIGSDKGRVYMRPEHRPTTRQSATLPEQSPQIRKIEPPVGTTPPVPSETDCPANRETLKITVRPTTPSGQTVMNGWQRVVQTSVTTDEVTYQTPTSVVETPAALEVAGSGDHHQGPMTDNNVIEFDRVLEGISGLCVTDILNVIEMLRSRPKIPLDQLLNEFEEAFQKKIEPTDGVEGLVDSLSRLGLLKVAANSDVSLVSPVRLRTFEHEPGQWSDVTDDDDFWNKYLESGVLVEGISMNGKVASSNESGFTFAPNWCPPDHLYGRAEIKANGEYIYSNGHQKLRAVALSSISMAGHWLIHLPDLRKFMPCRKEQLFVGPPQPVFDVIPIGRCPPVGTDVKLKIVQVAPGMIFACVDHEEPCCILKSRADSNFNFRVLHWDNQRFVPREDLAKLCLDKGLTSMDCAAIGHGDYFAAGSWMQNISDPFFIPMIELVELLETEGFREDAIHDLLLI